MEILSFKSAVIFSWFSIKERNRARETGNIFPPNKEILSFEFITYKTSLITTWLLNGFHFGHQLPSLEYIQPSVRRGVYFGNSSFFGLAIYSSSIYDEWFGYTTRAEVTNKDYMPVLRASLSMIYLEKNSILHKTSMSLGNKGQVLKY